MLEVGTKAPEIALPDQNGVLRRLSDHRGRRVILYFYPKDMTSGCTSQACGFRDLYPQFSEKGAVVIGVSRDSVASHKRFEEKYGLPFILLSDGKLEAASAYGALKPPKDDKPARSVARTTYLIDEDGVIIRALGSVKAKENPAEMLEML
ncbi:MAG: peroxiredoxin [Clostridia bacterium]|nr:peroxiredoxin [Clostridia bacterium]